MQDQSPPAASGRNENIRIVRRVLKELFDEGDLGATEELIHANFVNHEAPSNNPQGPEGLRETITWLHGLWGPMRAQIHDEICEGDKVVARVTMHGRHVGEFLGHGPTGKEFATKQIHIYRLQDGKAIEQWSVRDDLGQALQLGLFAAPEAAGG
jgi:predicted ester cyclase